MWEPVGTLPAAVYRRRRWIAMTSTAAAVLLVAWSATAVVAVRTADDTGPANSGALAAPGQVPPSSAAPRTGPSPAAASGPAGAVLGPPTPAPPVTVGPPFVVPAPGPPLGRLAPSVQAAAPGAPVVTSEEPRPDDTPPPSAPMPSPDAVPPTGPVPCTNPMLAVGAEIDRADHRVGQRPVLRLVVTNVGGQTCVRDLDAARQEIVVWGGDGARLWSSNDCANPSTADQRTLVPGRPVAFVVTWAGRRSTPGCASARTVVPAGAYHVLTRVDDIVSGPAPFRRSP